MTEKDHVTVGQKAKCTVYEGDPNADGAMTMLYHLYIGGVNSAICGHRIVSTRPNS